MHAGHGKDDAMQLSNLSGVGTPDKQFRVGVAFATAKIKWLLAWHNMARVRYFKIKRSGEIPSWKSEILRIYVR
jgi:hypothetical protein